MATCKGCKGYGKCTKCNGTGTNSMDLVPVKNAVVREIALFVMVQGNSLNELFKSKLLFEKINKVFKLSFTVKSVVAVEAYLTQPQ